MTPESNTQTAVHLETEKDLSWIHNHASLLSSKACGWFKLVGRGAILVDAAAKPLGNGSLFTYFSKDQFERFDDEEIDLALEEYLPHEEFVLVMLKPQDQIDTYRIQLSPEESST